VAENGKNWTATQRKYMEWLATPLDERMPLRHANLGEHLGVGERTLYRWRDLPGFYAEVNRIVDEHLGDAYADVANALKREATSGSFQHQKMYLELIGRYVQKIAPTTPDGTEQYTGADDDDTLIAKAAAIIARGAANPAPSDT
jgi:hypothetical protein